MALDGFRTTVIGFEGLHLAVAGDVHHLQEISTVSSAEVTNPAHL